MNKSFEFNSKEFLKGLLISNLIAGFGYLGLLYFSTYFGSEYFTNFLNNFFIIIIASATGCYFSFKDLRYSLTNSLGAILGINLSHIFMRTFIFKSDETFTFDFVKILILISFFGLCGGLLKFLTLKEKANPNILKEFGLEYELAKKYRMPMTIRIAGSIVGLCFVMTPFLVSVKDFNEVVDLEFWQIGLMILFLAGAFLMGLFFLSYCIPGKTPAYILKRLKPKSNFDRDSL